MFLINYGSRTLWKIITSGYGVCNGISMVEQYIFARLGIESEIINCDKHTFLKIKNIEIPLSNGTVIKGNTILDPTWNLSRHRFGGMPDDFLKSYSEMRKHDIDSNGIDHFCHQDDANLQDATLNLDEQSLRMLFSSVGLADEKGEFPIKALIEESKRIDEMFSKNLYRNICEQLKLLSRICPEFSNCQAASKDILRSILLNNKNMNFNTTIINRIYDKKDKNKRPILFVYIDSNEFGKKAFLADKNKGQFIEISKEDFQENYACYEEDILSNPQLEPWKAEIQKESIYSQEGEEK